MKLILLILSLFVFSCDSGGDGGGNSYLNSDLFGYWKVVYDCCDFCEDELDCDDIPEGSEIIWGFAEDGVYQDCGGESSDDMECADIGTWILDGDNLEKCEIDVEDDYYGCLSGVIHLSEDGESAVFTAYGTYDGCSYTCTMNIEKIN